MTAAPACYIHGVFTAVPELSLDAERGSALLMRTCADARSARLMQRVARLTGIRKRHLAALEHQPEGRESEWLYRYADVQPEGPGMEQRTAAFQQSADTLVRRLLSQAPADALGRLDMLVTASCTHASAPGLELPVFSHTPVPATVDRWNLGFMGCSAGLAGLRLVQQAAGACRRSMILACELSSLHFQYSDQLDQITANLLFADGAAAVLTGPEVSAVRIIDCRCVSLPKFAAQMVWFAADRGLKLRLAQELPDTLAEHLPGAVAQFLDRAGVGRGQIDHWLVHPGGPQVLEAVQKCLALPADALALSWSVFRAYGNMSSPTIFFILNELLACRAPGRAVALAFGPGLTIEMALLEITR